MTNDVKLFVAAKALISCKGRILLLQESSEYNDGTRAGEFDGVGGRVTPGERLEDGLKREILEETGMTVRIGKPFFVNESWPVVRGERWQVVRIFFEAFSDEEKVVLSRDHERHVWIDASKYKEYKIIGNLVPAFDAYLSLPR